MERYEVIRDIGSGNFGVAKLVRDVRTNELFAVKFIERGQKVVSFFLLGPQWISDEVIQYWRYGFCNLGHCFLCSFVRNFPSM